MQYALTISAKGESREDLATALEEMIRLIEEGFTSGENGNEYLFTESGHLG
jgi:hypothetical protein